MGEFRVQSGFKRILAKSSWSSWKRFRIPSVFCTVCSKMNRVPFGVRGFFGVSGVGFKKKRSSSYLPEGQRKAEIKYSLNLSMTLR
jgi:hypothetical protein